MNKDELTAYWVESSNRDFKTMLNLFKNKDYHWSLFVGHLVIEKLIKAYYVKNIGAKHPFGHDLLRLAVEAKLDLGEEQKDILDTISTFNIRARYDDYKADFYKLCTKEFTLEWVKKIKGFRQWLIEML
ncbi:MAG: HEPN domain-containing protein [Candidatus Aminicenantes bacterium]|nr:HEPN domain-containing protein [Candidatus Aminicenantes bacterium]